jgi:cell wall-associated NlpC family hydrolase
VPLTNEQREQIVAEAKTWIGTRYRGWSEVKGPKGGTDCGMLMKAVFQKVRLLPAGDLGIDMSYSLQANQHEADTVYLNKIEEYCREISESEALPGDLVDFKLALGYSHAAIIVEWPAYIVHCMAHGGVRGAHGMNHPKLFGKPRKFFTLKDEFCTTKDSK